MKLKKGSKLVMLTKKKGPLGSELPKEAIRSNAPYHTVRYNKHGLGERVNPHLEVSEAWAPGDVVEVFDNLSWKVATVSEVLGKTFILVRLLGSSHEFKVRKSNIRARRSWQDDASFMVGRGNNNCDRGKLQGNLSLYHTQKTSSLVQRKNLQKNDECFTIRDRSFQDKQNNTKPRVLKRSSNFSSESFCGGGHKVRVIEKEGRCLRVISANPSELPAQLDALGEYNKPASLNHRLGGHFDTNLKGKKPVSTVRELHDADSITCSVGSCSVNSENSSKQPCDISADEAEQIPNQLRDNTSPYRLGHAGHCLPSKEELAAEIHRLELHAYRCTIEALHASGPLSWEQEVLITNLRLSLNISNDEHLMQLKHLISADTSIPIR